MKKAARVVLAACMIFPLLATWAAPPEEAEPALPVATGELISLPVASSPLEAQNPAPGMRLPEGFEPLTPEVLRQYRVGTFVSRSPSASPGETPRQRLTVCMAGTGGDASLCDVAADIASMEPCLAANAEDCPAMEAWTHAMGQVGVYPAPQTTTNANIRPAPRVEQRAKEKD